jgi:excisionase family DNA binding protein
MRKGQAMEATGAHSPYLNTTEASAYCRINRSTLWRAVKAGHLKQYGPGTAVRYRRDELDRFMDARNRK